MFSSSIDWNQACALLGQPGDAVPDEMKELFHDMAQYVACSFEEIQKEPFTEENRANITKKSHSLRGSILNFGLQETADILLKIETEPMDFEKIRQALSHAQESCLESLEVLKGAYPSLLN